MTSSLGIVAGGEHPAAFVVPEEIEQPVGRRHGLARPAGVAGQLAEAGEGIDQGCVVVGVGEMAGAAVGLPRAEPATIVAPELAQEELAVGHRCGPPLGVAGGCCGLGEGREHQPVPFGEDLVVEPGPDAIETVLEQLGSGPVDLVGPCQPAALFDPIEDVRPLEVSFRRGAVPVDGGGGTAAEHLAHLVDRPHVELALDALAVGVLGREPPAVGVLEVAAHVVDRLGQHLGEPWLAGQLPGMEVGPGEQRVVVEHLLEVGHEPDVIDRVASETSAEVVVDAAGRHRIQRGDGGLQRIRPRLGCRVVVRPKQQVDAHRPGELGRTAEPSPGVVMGLDERTCRGVERLGAGQVVTDLELLGAAERFGEPARLVEQFAPATRPRLLHAAAELDEARHAAPALLREVGASEERLAFGGHEHRHRPPAAAGHGLYRVHVDGVDVGSLFAVDLDGDEEFVDDGGGGIVLEALVGHHVTPVAGGITDGQEDRLVLGTRLLERLGTPRIPVDRVGGVLAQIGRGLVGEPVHRDEGIGGQTGSWFRLCQRSATMAMWS